MANLKNSRSAFERLQHRYEGDDGEGTTIEVTIIADADAEAVEAALDEEEASADIADGEATADDDAAGEEEAAELSAMAEVLRAEGLTPGMYALLQASGKCALYNIAMPGKETMDVAGRNDAMATAIASAFEATAAGFWEGTKNFFAKIWDAIIRAFIWIKTHVGGVETRVKRAHDSLSGKSFDAEKGKDVKAKDLSEEKLKGLASAASTVLEKMRSVSSSMREGWSVSDAMPANDALQRATGYKLAEGGKGLEEADEKFMEGEEIAVTDAVFKAYQGSRFTAIQAIITMIKKADAYKTDAEACKKAFISFTENNNKNKGENGKMSEEAKKSIKTAKEASSAWMKIVGRQVKVLARACSMYVNGCGKARACAKSAD
jgi:hypothetical protein